LHGNFCRRQADLQKDRQELPYERQQGVQLREELRLVKGRASILDWGAHGPLNALTGKYQLESPARRGRQNAEARVLPQISAVNLYGELSQRR